MPIPHSIHPQVSAESTAWTGKGRCTWDTEDTLRIQESRD